MTVTISGSGPVSGVTTLGMTSGTITGLSAGGLPDGSVIQADLASGVAGNGPAFSVYLGTSQSVSAGTWTKIALDTETFDTNNNFASNRFTPTVAGYYQINATANTTSGSASTLYSAIYKNGSQYKFYYSQSSPNGASAIASDIIYFNGSTDYIELYCLVSSTVSISGDSRYTFMSGALVRAA